MNPIEIQTTDTSMTDISMTTEGMVTMTTDMVIMTIGMVIMITDMVTMTTDMVTMIIDPPEVTGEVRGTTEEDFGIIDSPYRNKIYRP